MGYFQNFIRQFRARLFLIILVNNVLILADWYVVDRVVNLSGWWALAAIAIVPLITVGVVPWITTNALTQPTKLLWQAIMHIAPNTAGVTPAPRPEQLHLGRELVTNLIGQLYQLASVVHGVEQTSAKARILTPDFAANSLPLPLLILDKENKIVLANEPAARYLSKPAVELVGQDVFTALDMSFMSADTLDRWLQATKGKTVISDHQWERVRIGLPGQEGKSLQFDLAAHYNQDNPLGYETLLVLFDHTATYEQDDQSLGFVALSVHELRTPLTLLRGYIEVFDDEIGPDLDPEMQRFMKQMDAAAQQLTAFVDNILNVAKIEDNQLTLQLNREAWPEMIDAVVSDMQLRAGVHGIAIKTDIAKELPMAGVDRYSIYELLANLLDNAIKYSKKDDEILVQAKLNKDGMIETSVIDRGVGVDGAVLPHIFDKFYRNHRNRAQIGGTGLGLYLAKTIIEAHGGNIWVSSKPGQGSTFTFTVVPYDKLEENRKAGNNGDVTRSAHGWIKNHSLYRD
jgi:signal transduction histidine kinase